MRFPLPAIGMVSVFTLVLPLGCSSSGNTGGGNNTGGAGGGQNQGVQGPGGTTPTGHDTNPDGVAYPTANLGNQQRTGNTPGNVINNYKFFGYPTSAVPYPTQAVVVQSGQLQTIALADLFDPLQKRYKLIHLGVAAVWCVPCNEETDATVPVIAQLGQEGVIFVQALSDGPIFGVGATQGDLNGWITKHKSNFSEMLDPGLTNLGQFFNAAAIPWNAIIDPRSMEILTDGVGFSGNIVGDVSPWLSWVTSNPPSYCSLDAQCPSGQKCNASSGSCQ